MPLVPEEARSVVDFNPEGAVALLGPAVGRYLAEHLHPVQAARLLPHFLRQRQEHYPQLQPPSVQMLSRVRARDLLLAATLRMEPPDGTPALTAEESAAVFACFSAQEVRQAMGGEHRTGLFPLTAETQTRLDEILDISYGNGAYQACGAAVAEGARIARAQGLTVVQRAAQDGRLAQLVPPLREGGAGPEDLMATVNASNSPLHLAAERGDPAAVDVLHAAGVPPDAMTARNFLGFAPVHLAATQGHAPFVRALGRYLSPAQLMEFSANDMSAAHCAGEAGHAAVFDALADSGVAIGPMMQANQRGYTPLHCVAERNYLHPRRAARETSEQRDQRHAGSKQVIDTLVRLGMPRELATAQDVDGVSPMLLAAERGNVAALRSMYHDTLNPEAVMAGCLRTGQTPGTHAAEQSHLDVFQFLTREARLPLPLVLKGDRFGSTPVHYAAGRGDTRMIGAIAEAGAGPDVLMLRNDAGETAFDRARFNGHGATVRKALIDAGVPGWELVALPGSPTRPTTSCRPLIL